VLADDDTLDAYLQRSVAGVWHPVGSCRMGADGDPLAVTTPQGRVRGVEALRVCDASVMPSIPCANTNISTIMVAEHMADLIKQEASA
jgi:5-(hydroxymethyl)furfural/furfural oxidase